MKKFFLSGLVFLLYRTLSWTWRIRLEEPPEMKKALAEGRPFILAHWHGDELALIHLARHYRIGTIVSQSEDGQIMNRVLIWLGARTARGSSTRGGVGALKGLIRLVREGANCSFAVDGPKGPIYQVKPGIFEVSRMLNLPIYWVGVSKSRAFEFPRSWNKTYLPKPFARICIQWSGPLDPVPENQDPRSLELAKDLERKLNAAKQQALVSIAEAGT